MKQILKKQDRELRAEAKAILEKLKSICPHEHTIILNSSYEGSYSYDYDDSFPGNRICLCCATKESSYDQNQYKILINPIKRFELYNNSSILKSPLEYGLNELLEKIDKEGNRG